MDAPTWSDLMDKLVAEATADAWPASQAKPRPRYSSRASLIQRPDLHELSDYNPGQVMAPGSGSGTEGDSPAAIRYAALGPLALVLNEAVDAFVNAGADRDTLMEAIAQAGGEEVNREEVDEVLAGEEKDPSLDLLRAFSQAVSIDLDILLDAAKRGGAKSLGPFLPPPGMP